MLEGAEVVAAGAVPVWKVGDFAFKGFPPRKRERMRHEFRMLELVNGLRIAPSPGIFNVAKNAPSHIACGYFSMSAHSWDLKRCVDSVPSHILSMRSALAIGHQLADRIETLHGMGLLHTGLKPENVCWEDDSCQSLILIDFERCKPWRRDTYRLWRSEHNTDEDADEISLKAGVLTNHAYALQSRSGMFSHHLANIHDSQLSRRGEMESIVYIIVSLVGGLPWDTEDSAWDPAHEQYDAKVRWRNRVGRGNMSSFPNPKDGETLHSLITSVRTENYNFGKTPSYKRFHAELDAAQVSIGVDPGERVAPWEWRVRPVKTTYYGWAESIMEATIAAVNGE